MERGHTWSTRRAGDRSARWTITPGANCRAPSDGRDGSVTSRARAACRPATPTSAQQRGSPGATHLATKPSYSR